MKLSITDELRYIGEQTSRFIPGEIYKIHSIDAKGVWVMPNRHDHNSTRVVFYHMEFDRYFEVVRAESEVPVEPIKLTKAQADALAALKMMTDDVNEILSAHARKFELTSETDGWEAEKLQALNELSITDLATALLVGYNVELTEKEKALASLQSELEKVTTKFFDDPVQQQEKVQQIIKQIELMLDGEQNDSQ